MKKNSFIKGTIIASSSIILIKLLGAAYVIPFYRIIGVEGGALYSYAYNIYNLFLNISTAGIPVAMSMIISEYYTLGYIDAKIRANKIGNVIVFSLSLLSFLAIFIFAPYIAKFLTSNVELKNSINDITLAIRAISICLLINPVLGVLRGYLQGHKYISPSSNSQIIEQIVRIIIVIAGSYISIRILHLSVPIGVAIALTGAFFGGFIAYIYLLRKAKKSEDLSKTPDKKDSVKNKEILKKILSYSFPLIFISIISNLYDTIDLKLIIKGLTNVNYTSLEVETISSIIVTWGPKICMIIMAVAMGLTTNLIPHVVGSFTKGDKKALNKYFNQSIGAMLLATIPMSLIIFFLSKEIYFIFYGKSTYGPIILSYLAIINVIMGVLTVINTCLQGMKKFKIIYLNTFIGLLINTILDIPLIYLFNRIGYAYIGTIIASIIGCIASYVIVYFYLRKNMDFRFRPLLKICLKLILPTITMLALLVLYKTLIHINTNYLTSILQTLLLGGISFVIYVYIAYKNGLLYEVLGKEYVDKITSKLKLRR